MALAESAEKRRKVFPLRLPRPLRLKGSVSCQQRARSDAFHLFLSSTLHMGMESYSPLLNRRVECLVWEKRLAAVCSQREIAAVFLTMITRSLLFLTFTLSLASTIVPGVPVLLAADTAQSTAAVAKAENQESSARSEASSPLAVKPSPPVQEIKARTPFVLKGLFRQLPEKTAGEVRLFEGMAGFQKVAAAEELTAWPIAKFASATIPKDEAEFRRVLCAHAGNLGADYVVLITDQQEIKEFFQPRFEKLVYCALAYKRAKALLGIDRDETAAQENVMKIRGFMRDAHAEQSGLQVGDIIKTVDGVVPGEHEKYWSKAVRWKAGDKVKVEVERDGKTIELEVELVAG